MTWRSQARDHRPTAGIHPKSGGAWPDRAVRIDPRTGVREEAEFIRLGDAQLFGFSHVPTTGVRACALVCSPLLAEFRKNYRREVELGRMLAADGVAVQRFHYRGSGNSGGSQPEMTLDSLREDAVVAATRLEEAAGAPVSVVIGTRLGAFVALAACRALNADALVLWDPTIEASAYFRDAFRARFLRDLREGATGPGSGDHLLQMLKTDGHVDVLGYTIHRRLYESLSGRRIVDQTDYPPKRALVVQIGSRSRDAKGLAEVASLWRQRGSAVELAVIEKAEPWWLVSADDGGSGDMDMLRGTVGVTHAWVLASLAREPVS